jgi:hypothetical protein
MVWSRPTDGQVQLRYLSKYGLIRKAVHLTQQAIKNNKINYTQ